MLPGGALNLQELEQLAREKLSAMAYAYYASGALEEHTLRENVAAWARLPIHYRVLVDVSARDLSTTVLGTRVSMPVLVAPTAFHGLACADGELATVRAAPGAGTVMCLSSLSNTRVEEVCAAAGGPGVVSALRVPRPRSDGGARRARGGRRRERHRAHGRRAPARAARARRPQRVSPPGRAARREHERGRRPRRGRAANGEQRPGRVLRREARPVADVEGRRVAARRSRACPWWSRASSAPTTRGGPSITARAASS